MSSSAPYLPKNLDSSRYVRALERAMGAAKAAIVLIGPRGLGNTQQYERELAFVRQTHEPAFPIVPVILPETTIEQSTEINLAGAAALSGPVF
jgi:hypothetical protein